MIEAEKLVTGLAVRSASRGVFARFANPTRSTDIDHIFLTMLNSIDNRPPIADFPTHRFTLEELRPSDPFAAGF